MAGQVDVHMPAALHACRGNWQYLLERVLLRSPLATDMTYATKEGDTHLVAAYVIRVFPRGVPSSQFQLVSTHYGGRAGRIGNA